MSYGPKTSVVLTPEQARRHLDAAADIAQKLLQEFQQGEAKPYDQALGCYLALTGLCKQFGWHPQDFHQWVAHQFPVRD